MYKSTVVTTEVPPASIRLGLVAYEFVPDKLVFVRIPNEPGRWVLTHHSVAKVACPWCRAVVGEPCFTGKGADVADRRYTAGTYCLRNRRAKMDKGRAKVRVTAADLTPGVVPL